MEINQYSSVFHRSVADDVTVARSVIIKLSGETCNINCSYCYEKRKPYPNSKYLHPDTLKKFLDKIKGEPISVELHGGEPLIIGKERMRELLEILRTYQNILRVSLQTNATLLDAEWIKLFLSLIPKLQFGISLDGDEIANSMRLDYKDRSTSIAVAQALDLISNLGGRCGIICVVSNINRNYPNSLLKFFARWPAIKTISFVPCFDFSVVPEYGDKGITNKNAKTFNSVGNNNLPYWAITPQEFTEFLCAVTRYWVDKSFFHNFALEPIMSVIRKLEGRHTNLCHFTNLKCNQVMTLYPDGRVGSCDELPMPLSLLGQIELLTAEHIRDNLSGTPAFQSFIPILDKCLVCSYREICGGGCLATRLRYFGTNYYEDYCHHRINVIESIKAIYIANS